MKETPWLRLRGQNRVDRILGDCWQWETNGQCSKGNNCSFRHDINKRAKMTQPNPSPNSFMQQDEKKASKTRSPRGRSPRKRCASTWAPPWKCSCPAACASQWRQPSLLCGDTHAVGGLYSQSGRQRTDYAPSEDLSVGGKELDPSTSAHTGTRANVNVRPPTVCATKLASDETNLDFIGFVAVKVGASTDAPRPLLLDCAPIHISDIFRTRLISRFLLVHLVYVEPGFTGEAQPLHLAYNQSLERCISRQATKYNREDHVNQTSTGRVGGKCHLGGQCA